MPGLIDLVLDWFTGDHQPNVVDLYFVTSDLKDMPYNDSERAQWCEFDSKAMKARYNEDGPIGKQVK